MRKLLTLLMLIPSPAIAHDVQSGNHLADARSPYLRQYADYPVKWYPWGIEALTKARTERKLVFVSVGYSACPTCQMMEEESFNAPEIAAYMNENFISIKVDRDQRPDLGDQFLRIAKQVKGTSGGPNSIFLTPDGQPFSSGTYQPPETFFNSLKINVDLWQSHPQVIEAKSNKLRAVLDAQ